MGHAIPKIHYSIVSTTGNTTNLNVTVSAIPDTSQIAVGMFVTGTGIPAGVTVASKTASSVDLSLAATATASTISLEFFKKIEFEFPPVEKGSEKLFPQERRSLSLSGISQVSIDHIEGVRALVFSFLSNTLYLQLKAFYDESAVYGISFRYFDDKTLTDYLSYELKNFDWDAKKIAPKGTSYVWAVPLQFRRVV